MSGYGSISDYAFDPENFDLDDYDDYETFLKDLENDFLSNGRSSLNKIFDQSDFNRLENEFNELKEEKEAQKEERVQTISEIFSPVVEVVEKVSGFIKGLFS
jgi:predicted nuclease with TOPRIM domain